MELGTEGGHNQWPEFVNAADECDELWAVWFCGVW